MQVGDRVAFTVKNVSEPVYGYIAHLDTDMPGVHVQVAYDNDRIHDIHINHTKLLFSGCTLKQYIKDTAAPAHQ